MIKKSIFDMNKQELYDSGYYEYLKKYNIYKHKKIYELSGGEAQRVALAKVILKDPPLILADELTAALDPETSQEVMDLLLMLKSQERIIIIATHNPVIWEKADEVVKLN